MKIHVLMVLDVGMAVLGTFSSRDKIKPFLEERFCKSPGHSIGHNQDLEMFYLYVGMQCNRIFHVFTHDLI